MKPSTILYLHKNSDYADQVFIHQYIGVFACLLMINKRDVDLTSIEYENGLQVNEIE